MSEMTPDKAAALRERFPAAEVGKLPKVNCGACTAATRQATRASEKHCDRHVVRECPVCKAYITAGHIHLDYVGHAAVTSRLCAVDPEWTWRPMGVDDAGLPMLDRGNNLWIWLTVCGVTKPGVGDGASAKECIGDAIRNAAMRFGVAVDLWSKEELEVGWVVEHAPAHPATEAPPAAEQSAPAPSDSRAEASDDAPLTSKTRAKMFALFAESGIADADAQRRGMAAVLGHPVESRGGITESEGQRVVQSLASRKDHRS